MDILHIKKDLNQIRKTGKEIKEKIPLIALVIALIVKLISIIAKLTILLVLTLIILISIGTISKNILDGVFKWNWDAISAIVLMITMTVIAAQAWYTKRYTELSVMPNAFFVPRSQKTESDREGKLELWKKMLDKEKLHTQFIIQNNSKFPILFKVKITFNLNGKKLPHDNYWGKDSLQAYPGRVSYPDVIHLDDVIKKLEDIKDGDLEGVIKNKKISDEKIIADIKYKYTPRFIEEYSKEMEETWTFHFKSFTWSGPNGINDEKIYLTGEKPKEEVEKKH